MTCWTAKPPEPPKALVWAHGSVPTAPHSSVAVASSSRHPQPPDPGNRVNNRVVKTDDGAGVLCPEDMTAFHILCPGRWFHEELSVHRLKPGIDFTVQYVDSDWSVKKFISGLGGLEARLSASEKGRVQDQVCLEEWHEAGNGYFTRGSHIFYHDESKSCKSLREMGWGPEHGKAGQKPPVWVMLYP